MVDPEDKKFRVVSEKRTVGEGGSARFSNWEDGDFQEVDNARTRRGSIVADIGARIAVDDIFGSNNVAKETEREYVVELNNAGGPEDGITVELVAVKKDIDDDDEEDIEEVVATVETSFDDLESKEIEFEWSVEQEVGEYDLEVRALDDTRALPVEVLEPGSLPEEGVKMYQSGRSSIYEFDPDTGETLETIVRNDPEISDITSVFVKDGVVYFAGDDRRSSGLKVGAYTIEGDDIWYANYSRLVRDVIVKDDLLFHSSGRYNLRVLDPDTGDMEFIIDLEGRNNRSIEIIDDILLVVSSENLEAFDLTEFDEEDEEYERLWFTENFGFEPRLTSVDYGIFYAFGRSNEIISVDVDNGSEIDLLDIGFEVRDMDVRDGVGYVLNSDNQTVVAYDVGDWSVKWETDMTFEGNLSVISTIPGSVFVGTSDGELGRLNPENGAVDYEVDTPRDHVRTIDSNLWAFEMES